MSTCHCVDVAMGSYDNQVSMLAPFDLPHRDDRWVTIDTCIATEIGWLWHQGVVTLNSCCGHQQLPPSVIVAEASYDLMGELGYEWDLAPSGLRAHRLTGLPLTDEMVERAAEAMSSHVPNTDGVLWMYEHEDGEQQPVTLKDAARAALTAALSGAS